MDRKVLLMILDGWGEGKHNWTNAIYTQGGVRRGAGRTFQERFPVDEDRGACHTRKRNLRTE